MEVGLQCIMMQMYKTVKAEPTNRLLQNYLDTVNPDTYTPQCLLCLKHTHDTNHLFNCSQVQTQHY